MQYDVVLLFFWIESPQVAIKRIAERVERGGHNIPTEVVERRYFKGIKNLFQKFIPLVDYWMVFDNSTKNPLEIAGGKNGVVNKITNYDIWEKINQAHNERL